MIPTADAAHRPSSAQEKKNLTAAAQRALAEAKERALKKTENGPTEIGGRGGLDPVRFGDWEVKGLTSDF